MVEYYHGKTMSFHPQPKRAEEDFQAMVRDPLDARSNEEKWQRACLGRGITKKLKMPVPCERASMDEIIEEMSSRRDSTKVRIDLPSGD